MVTLALVCTEGDYIDLCCIVSQRSMPLCACVRVSLGLFAYMCVHRWVMSTQVFQNLSLCRQISQRFEKLSLLLHPVNLFTRDIHGNKEVKVRLEVSREFRRDRKDFVLPRKYLFHQLKMIERVSDLLRNRVPHEQPRLRPLRHTPL